MGVERVKRVGADLACPDPTQDGPDDPVDVAAVGREGGFSEIGDLEVLVEDLVEEDVAGGGLVAVGLLDQTGERRRRVGLIRACLLEDPFLAGYRVFADVDPHPVAAARCGPCWSWPWRHDNPERASQSTDQSTRRFARVRKTGSHLEPRYGIEP